MKKYKSIELFVIAIDYIETEFDNNIYTDAEYTKKLADVYNENNGFIGERSEWEGAARVMNLSDYYKHIHSQGCRDGSYGIGL